MRIVMMGTGTFAEPTLEALIARRENIVGLITQPDRDTGRASGSTRQTGQGMAAIAQAAGIPVIQPPSINSPEGLELLTAWNPDLLVVAAYGQILSKAVLGVPGLGAINVHASLLPRHRGASPVAHAILAGDAQTGVTIIRITPGLDAGEMLAVVMTDIAPEETTGELEARLAQLGAIEAVQVVEAMKQGPVAGTKQDPALVTKAPKLTKEMGQIDWSQSAEVISRHIRAMQPWPTAYTYLHREGGKAPVRVIVSRAVPADTPTSPLRECGQIIADTPNVLRIQTGSGGVLEIRELQPAGKKRMTAAEFLRGCPLRSGDRFGPERLP